MSRNIQVTLPSEYTDRILPKIKRFDGLIGLRLQKNISIEPPGDVLDFDVINSQVTPCMKMLEDEGLLLREDVSITTSKPTSVISKSKSKEILSETHETSWEDILKNLLHQSDMNLNSYLVMFCAGVVAAIGISSNSLHTVIGAMLIAPGFEPISRAVLGLVTNHRDWRKGTLDTITGYGVLIAGGLAGGVIAGFFIEDVLPGTATYLDRGSLVDYWMGFSAISITVSIFASFVGGIIIMTNKSILTAGVMVALALIPTAALVGMWLLEGNLESAGIALLRLLLEIFIVALLTGGVFLWKKNFTHKRNMQA